jgi:branched-subunit amino acid aminotransferase/4-amino-4-deoxychorismate lyase
VFRLEIDGVEPDAELMRATLTWQYGNFTAAQVRGRRVRGLDLHLARLEAASREMFGTAPDAELIRARVRHALGDDIADASLRVTILRPGASGATPTVVITATDAGEMAGAPQRLRSVRWVRSLPHIKQVGGNFGQIYFGTAAEREGYDDALLTGDDGLIAETTVANIGFFAGGTVVWPVGPLLQGTTKLLLERHGPALGLKQTSDRVILADAPAFSAAFVCNSRGLAPVASIDEYEFAVDTDLMARLNEVYDAAPWDEI